MDRREFLGLSAAFGLCGAPRAEAAPLPVLGGPAFGSYWRVTLGQTAKAAPISEAVDRVVARIDAGMSPYLAGSEVSRLNAVRDAGWRPVSADLGVVLEDALAVARQTGGAFDPTVGGIVGRYGFGPIRGPRTGDVSDLALRDGALHRARPGMTLDLCGIAKGRALDLIGAELAAQGVTDALIELGGEVLALGRHPEGRSWRVAIEAPGAGLAGALELDGLAVATSGDRPQGYTVAGARYGHIIDPRRGAPATGDLVSVSVIGARAMRADALATALFAQGTEAAGRTAEALDLDTLLLVRDGSGVRVLTTGRAGQWLL